MRLVSRMGEEKLEIVPEVENGILAETSELTENQINYAVEKEKKGNCTCRKGQANSVNMQL
jgi:hypothetical protein